MGKWNFIGPTLDKLPWGGIKTAGELLAITAGTAGIAIATYVVHQLRKQ